MARREVTPIIRALRNFMNGRQSTDHIRHEQNQSPRSAPPPSLPTGSSHAMSDNNYHERDGRRESQPAAVVYAQGPKQIEGEVPSETIQRVPQPGAIHNWDM